MDEPVGVELLDHRLVTLDQPDARLEVGAGREVLHRQVLLYGKSSGLRLIHGQSRLVLDRLTRGMRADLLRGDLAIGPILRKHRVETLRSPIDTGLHQANAEVARHFGPTMMCYRTYAIIAAAKPLMVVHEEFPRTSFAEQPRASSTATDAAPSDPPRRPHK